MMSEGWTNKIIPSSSIITGGTNKNSKQRDGNMMTTWWQRDGIVMSKHDETHQKNLRHDHKRWAYQRSLKFQDP
jgi:hypothetical protein